MRSLLLGLLLLLLSPLLCADTPPLITFDQGQLSILRDPSKQLTLGQARAARATGQFRPISGNLGLGYIPDAVWLHLSVERTAGQSSAGWLEIMPPYLDDVQLFHIRPDGKIDTRRGGDRLPQSAKEEDYRGALFKLEWQPGAHEIYLRLQTTSAMAAIVKLWQPDRFERQLRLGYFAYGLYFSLILTVLLFNTVNWLVSRRWIFLVYVGYLFLNALQWLGINGFVAEFIFPAQPLLANLTLGMSLSLAAAMAFGFFIMVLELEQHHPVLYRISLAGMALCIATALATPLGYYGIFAPLMLGFGVLALCGVPWPALRLWRMGDLWARLLAAAYLIYGVLIGINILGVLAVLPFGETINLAGMASNIAHILLLHFAILLHYRRIEADHAEALEKSVLAQRVAVTAVEPLPKLIGDDRMLRFALLNLLDNAGKYSPPDTPVRVRIEAVNGGVAWRVEDDGPGIPPGMEEKIFEKYVRVGETSGKAGLGLGLYLARHIVERHGGKLTVETGRQRGGGACFVCWLPIDHLSPQEDAQ